MSILLLAVVIAALKVDPSLITNELINTCRNRLEDTKMCAHHGAMGWDAIEVEDDDFCSYGERKDND